MKICANINCNETIPSTIKIDGQRRNLCSRKYCLLCSPFGEHNTTKLEHQKSTETKQCPDCKQNKSNDEFYQRRNGTGLSSYCKTCTNNQTINRQRKLKIDAIEYLGSKCADCKTKGHPAIFDFHHLDPFQKDFTIGHCKLYSLERIKPELDKCILLCSNCHRLRHANY